VNPMMTLKVLVILPNVHVFDLIVRTATSPIAKRRRLEKAAHSENVSPSKPPSKTKRSGLSRRVQGRLQNMLSLPLDVLFVV
jgi:hypothetical protein